MVPTTGLPQPPFWMLAAFKFDRKQLGQKLGEPHYIETDSTRTYGGNEEQWYFTFESGQKIIITYQVPYNITALYSNSPELKPIIDALGLPDALTSDASRFETCNPPCPA